MSEPRVFSPQINYSRPIISINTSILCNDVPTLSSLIYKRISGPHCVWKLHGYTITLTTTTVSLNTFLAH